MKIPKAFFVVSAWNNDVSWVKEYTDNYVIYDKSGTLPPGEKIIRPINVGYNIHDILHFIISHYDTLPELVAFLEGNPFDHCNREKFDKIIFNQSFTPIESYEHLPESSVNKKGADGGYMEFNNSWYIRAHISTYGPEVNRYLQSYNQFLKKVFKNPKYPQWIRFSPGGQYIVPKENILFYSKEFYARLMSFVDYHSMPSEAHLIERALYTIFTNEFQEKDQFSNQFSDQLNDLGIRFIDFGKKNLRRFLPENVIKMIRRIRKRISR